VVADIVEVEWLQGAGLWAFHHSYGAAGVDEEYGAQGKMRNLEI
jgi:hypothetical protein